MSNGRNAGSDMCGILGMIAIGDAPITDSGNTTRALNLMAHRGPDDGGEFRSDRVYFGHRRLAIIDLEMGRQPMTSTDSRFVIVSNSEIFNYRELRREFIDRGYEFATQSDTEVILAAYHFYGERCVEQLRGMFAFAVYDTVKDVLFVARDRFGIKPLFYAVTDEAFVFASEIKSIYAITSIPCEVSTQHLNEFLIFGYIAGAETMHRHIRELPAAHSLVLREGRPVVSRYWYGFGFAQSTDIGEDEAVTLLAESLQNAVESWTTADVEVASLLSGGVDSSTITALAAGKVGNLRSFSAWFPNDPALDERAKIQETVAWLDCSNELIAIEDGYLIENLERLIAVYDEPILDANCYTLMALCESIRNSSDLKVILCGEGADELFGGYERHRIVPGEFAADARAETMIYALNRVALPRLSLFADSQEINNPYRWELFDARRSKQAVNIALELDQQTFLGAYLHRQDKVGMLFGFEIRTPFLDHLLAEQVNALPAGLKINGAVHKHVLRRAAERWVPKSVVRNVSKVPFSLPVERMMAEGPLRNRFDALLNDNPKLGDHFDVGGIQKLLALHDPTVPGQNHANTLWRLLALELWLRTLRCERNG